MKKRTVLRVIRAAHEPPLSQSQTARLAGMARFRYWQIENGELPMPSDDERDAIASALGVKAADIDWPEFAKSLSA